MATDDLRRLVAQGVATGQGTRALAQRFDYSERGMRDVIKDPRTQMMIEEEREYLAQAAERTRNELIGLGPPALRVLAEVLNDPHHLADSKRRPSCSTASCRSGPIPSPTSTC